MDKLREADTVVSCLGQAMIDGESGLKNVPGLLLRVINEDLWQERIIAQTGQPVRFKSFIDFVATKPLEGLGADLSTLERLCSNNPAALEALDKATTGRKGERNDLVDNINYVDSPDGTSTAYALRKLRTDAPTLHARVLAGEISPHAAMVEAGYRRKMIQIPSDVEGAARTLSRKFTSEELRRLVELLAERIAVDA
jgi:hypothetical protein